MSLLQRYRALDDKFLIGPKAVYFMTSVLIYVLHLFRAQFIDRYLHLTKVQFGDIASIVAAVGFLFMASWSSLADNIGRHRGVLVFICVASSIVFEMNYFAASIPDQDVRGYVVKAIFGGYMFFLCGMPPLSDYIVLKMLAERPGFSRDLYGRQRLWGTVSYGITSAVVGVITDKNSRFGMVSLFFILPVATLLTVAVIIAVCPADDTSVGGLMTLFRRRGPSSTDVESAADAKDSGKQSEKSDEVSPQKSVSSAGNMIPAPANRGDDVPIVSPVRSGRKPLLALLSNPNFSFMLFVVFMTGSARAVMSTFLSKYWTAEMDLSQDQVSLAANFGLVPEVFIFFVSRRLLQKFGIYWMLIIAQIAMVVRCWAYVMLPASKSSMYAVFAVELLKGTAFGFAQSAGVRLAADCAPPGLEATAQALYTSVYSQLPAVLTAVIGGRMEFDILFLVTSWVSTAALGLFLVKYFLDGSIAFCGVSVRRPARA